MEGTTQRQNDLALIGLTEHFHYRGGISVSDGFKDQTWFFSGIIVLYEGTSDLCFHFMPDINGRGTSGENQYLSLKRLH